LLLFDPAPMDRAPELAFVAALALRDAVIAEAPVLAPSLAFKWPNDLLLAGEKCAGILIEGEFEPPHGMTAVIGIGVNCAHHPATATDRSPDDPGEVPMQSAMVSEETALYPATDLGRHHANITPERLFGRLSATMCRRLAQWDRGRGFPSMLGDWLSAARGVGEIIRVRNGMSEKTGRFVGLDQSGRLVLELPGGSVEKISAGDVFPFTRHGGTRVPSQQD
jgi:BirA family biotin operon repressor/biotin-[acetyl-CoA-carboxylase] ligase